jgi:hypothetical protein
MLKIGEKVGDFLMPVFRFIGMFLSIVLGIFGIAIAILFFLGVLLSPFAAIKILFFM